MRTRQKEAEEKRYLCWRTRVSALFLELILHSDVDNP